MERIPWTVEAFTPSEVKYRALIENITNGYALYEVRKDQRGEPVRYIFREVNSVFARQMGARQEDVIGREIAETVMAAGYSGIDWSRLFQDTARDGRPRTFEKHSGLLGRWFWISVFSPLDGYVAVLLADITEQKEKLEYQAHYDLLTGLPNRRLLEDRLMLALVQAQRNREQVAVVFFDLENFKLLVEVHGQRAGDELIQEVARRTVGCLRQSDTVARVGSDALVLILPAVKTRTYTLIVANRVLEECRRPVRLGEAMITVQASMYIRFLPQDAATFSGAISKKDARMYLSRQQQYAQIYLTV